jgi:DNA-binding SARP family transcriptional activator
MTAVEAPGSATTTLGIRLLGPLEVVVADRPVIVDTRKALAIVALVAAEMRPFARDELAAIFWPEAGDEAARGALRRTLSALRTAVGDTGLRIERTRVALEAGVEVDLAQVERMATSSARADLEAAAALVRGPFLAGFALRDSPAFDDWQAARASRVEALVAGLLDRLATVRWLDGDVSEAIDLARRRVELDPLDEGGQRRLIELLAGSGDRAGAIGQYRSLVALFDRELGVPPLRETTELYDAIREGSLPGPSPSLGTGRPVAATSPPAPSSLPLAGRDRDLQRLVDAWRAADPDGRLAVVEGEAGIGKTRLAEALASTVRAGGGRVLASRGYPGEGAVAYGPIAELLRAGISLPDGADRLAALDEAVRRELSRLLDLPSSSRVTAVPPSDGPSARVRFLDAIATALTTLATGDAPGLVWIDDLHLADEPTRAAAAYLARRLAGRHLLLLLAWRREDLPADALVVGDDLIRIPGTTLVTLGRLDRPAVVELVRAARPATDEDASIQALADDLHAESEGLPLHVVEALAGGGSDAAATTGGVQAILHERIASVGETAGQVLAAASVIGRSFDLTTVRLASGRSEDEVVVALEELMRRGLVREWSDAADGSIRYDFSHRRLRDAAYDTTSLARRRLLHRRTADALRSGHATAIHDPIARFALIGAHEREAGRPAEAVAAYLEAAARAEAVYANREAIEHLDAALALGDPEAATAHARIGELRSRLGEYPAAIAALETAAALAGPDELAGIETALGRVHRRRGDLAAAASHLDSALAAPRLPDDLHARALTERSLVALRAGDLQTAATSASAARIAAARAGDPRLTGRAERLVGLVAWSRGDLATAIQALDDSVALASGDPDPTSSIAALTGRALALAASGAVDEGVAAAEQAIAACRRIGDRHLEAAVENHLADLLHEAGRQDESMIHLKRAVALFAEVGEGAPEREPGVWALAAW